MTTTSGTLPRPTGVLALILLSALAPTVHADARSIALGDSVIAHGIGVGDLASNPALLMRLGGAGSNPDPKATFVDIGSGFDVRDSGGATGILSDNAFLPENVENSLIALASQDITCLGGDVDGDTPCLSDTAGLGRNAERLADALERLDGQSVDTRLFGRLGMARLNGPMRFALAYGTRFVASGTVADTDADRDTLTELSEVLSDDTLTLAEAQNTTLLDLDSNQQALNVALPEQFLTSEASGGVLIRHQFSLTLASRYEIGGLPVDIGVTPHVSILQASSLDTRVADLFDDSMIPLDDQFDRNGVEDTAFNADVGLVTQINPSLSVGLSGRSLASESISTAEGYTFETTPQGFIGGEYSAGLVSVSVSAALNAAMVDNLRSQPLALGLELGNERFAVRTGISADDERLGKTTLLGLGVSLGALELGVRGAGADTLQAQLDISFGF